MRTLSDGSIHFDVAELNVNNLSGMKLLERNYDCYTQSQRPIRYFTPFPGRSSHRTMCLTISKNYPQRTKSPYDVFLITPVILFKLLSGSCAFSVLVAASTPY